MVYRLIYFYAFFLLINFSYAGEKYQINFLLAPSYESISFRTPNVDNPLIHKFSYNLGAEYKYFTSAKWSISAGLQFNDRGYRSEPFYINSSGDTLDQGDAVIIISAKYITLPLNLTFNFQPFFRTELFASTGFGFGYLVGQSFRGKRISSELGRPDDPLYESANNERSNIAWFDKSYVSWNIGVGVTRYIKSRLVITFNPMYYRQIDRLVDPFGPVNTLSTNNSGELVELKPKLNSFALNIKVGWYFNDQIENTKKSL